MDMEKKGIQGGCKIFLAGLVIGVAVLACSGYVIGVTDQRPFCAQCHSMKPMAVTQKLSTHTNVTCNECHLPQGLANKLPVKANIGISDIVAENFGDVRYPIAASQSMKDIINANCKSCHAATNLDVASMESKRYCTDCHRNVPHQRTQPVSTRMVA
jgi:cytochrome c nitrite reductase small subunit